MAQHSENKPVESAASSPHSSVTEWIQRMQAARDESAAQRLYDRYWDSLCRLAQSKLTRRGVKKGEKDGEDVAQDVLIAFCRRMEEGAYPDLNDRQELWNLFLTFVDNRCFDVQRRQLAEKRRGEVGESALDGAADSSHLGGIAQCGELAPPNEELADSFFSEAGAFIKSLGPELGEVARLKLEGYTNAEIAKKIGRVERTVERKLVTIREIWEIREKWREE